MLKFFRKIRQKLLAENKLTRYLIYALGEIVLVVIGILIAVGINSYYNNYQNEIKIQNILVQIQNDLITDIKDGHRILNFRLSKDSIARKIFLEPKALEEFKSEPHMLNVPTGYVSFTTQKGGYNRFMQNLENLPERYHSLIPLFNGLYVEKQNDIDDANTAIKNTSNNIFVERLKDPKTADHYLDNYSKEETFNYYFNDPQLKNKTIHYMGDLYLCSRSAIEYGIEARSIYKKIDSLLGTEITNYPPPVGSLPDDDSFQSFLGEYKEISSPLENDEEISIRLENGQLILRDSGAKSNLYWHEDALYTSIFDSVLEFYITESGQHAIKFSSAVEERTFILKKDL